MDAREACKICGCKQTNLIDGFYYCVECGTQDTNVRETLIEDTLLEDGHIFKSRKRITQIPQPTEVQMTDDWYKWHCLNFLLRKLADEVIEVGAAPSFKTKLLWVWTRYMKKFQNIADFGLPTNEVSDENEEIPMDEPDSSASEDEIRIDKRRTCNQYVKDITKITMPLILTFLYVALNIDQSHIQLSHLLRFIREERISILNWQKLVPKELKPKKLIRALVYDSKAFRYSSETVRILSISLFRTLNLGNPIVPDLRRLVDEYFQELCLPHDLKQLVLSLIHYRSFDYLDRNVQFKDLRRLPSYELYVMSHILMALKICFILDCEYEVHVSDAVDKINVLQNYPKSYNSEPTERLFSFRDWYNYIQFRQTLLRTHTLYLGAPNYFDMNDYVATEHQREKADNKIDLKDEIAMGILHKIESGDINVIPRSEFVATMTPHSSYSRIIAEHLQDPDVKQLLYEDFTQYSLKYILEDMFLVDLDSTNPKNILIGLNLVNFREKAKDFDFSLAARVYSQGQVYVKDCDNHNWMITNRPKLEHVSTSNTIKDSSDKNYDNGYESDSEIVENVEKVSGNLEFIQKSNIETKENSLIFLNNTAQNDISSITDIEMETENKENTKYLRITEEAEDSPIFDDNFLDLEIKKEDDHQQGHEDEVSAEISESYHIPNSFNAYNAQTQEYFAGEESDVSSVDSIRFNPETLNREEAIKELVIHACNKLKISTPGKYIQRERKPTIRRRRKPCGSRHMGYNLGEVKQKVNSLISAYHSFIQHDLLHQMSNMVQSAIEKFNQSTESPEIAMEVDEAPHEVNNDTLDVIPENEQKNESEQNAASDKHETVAEVDEYNLFGDSSDGETRTEDLLPKKNPNFDETTHDVRQLFIKPSEDISVPTMKLSSKLKKIIDQQIETEQNDPALLDLPPTISKDDTDSEDELALTLLQEQKRIREQLTVQEQKRKKGHCEYLFQSDIPAYNYWVRHYGARMIQKDTRYYRFATDIDTIFPKTFVAVLKECADVVGFSAYNLYKGLQNVERFLTHKYVDHQVFGSTYIKLHHTRKKDTDF